MYIYIIDYYYYIIITTYVYIRCVCVQTAFYNKAVYQSIEYRNRVDREILPDESAFTVRRGDA